MGRMPKLVERGKKDRRLGEPSGQHAPRLKRDPAPNHTNAQHLPQGPAMDLSDQTLQRILGGVGHMSRYKEESRNCAQLTRHGKRCWAFRGAARRCRASG